MQTNSERVIWAWSVSRQMGALEGRWEAKELMQVLLKMAGRKKKALHVHCRGGH